MRQEWTMRATVETRCGSVRESDPFPNLVPSILDHSSVESVCKLELEMKPCAKNIYWAAVCVVSGICDELIIDRDMDVPGYFHIVVGLDHFFERVMWQFPIADQRPQAPRSEKRAMSRA